MVALDFIKGKTMIPKYKTKAEYFQAIISGIHYTDVTATYIKYLNTLSLDRIEDAYKELVHAKAIELKPTSFLDYLKEGKY
jgi:hypothetical protein